MYIDIAAPAGTAAAYVAQPTTDAPAPGVLLFIDAIGLRPQIESMADRIASWGYVVLAPNVFYRDGSPAQTSPTGPLDTAEAREAFMAGAMPRVRGLTPDKSTPDTVAYLDALRSLDRVADGPVGVTGYCMGARLSTRAAIDHPDVVAACGGFHGGGIVTDDPDSIHRSLGSARAEFVYGHADNDRSMSAEAVQILGRTLSEAGLTASNAIYPDAPHGYTMKDTPMYQEAGAERHFAELRDLLDRTLKGTDMPRINPGGLRQLGPINFLIAKIGGKVIRADDMHLFSTLGRDKRVFLGWLGYSGMLMPFGSLKRRESETVIVRVASLRGNDYELGHHRRIGAQAGLSDEQFERIFDGTGWDERSAALLAAVTELVQTKAVTEETWARLAAHYDERRLVEIVLLTTNYDGLATTIDVLGIEPERP